MKIELNQPDQFFWLSFVLWLLIIYFFISDKNNLKNVKTIIFLRISVLGIIVFLFLEKKLNFYKKNKYDLNWNLYVDKSLSMSYHTNPSLGSLNSGINYIIDKFEDKNVEIKTYGFGESLDSNWINSERAIKDGSTNMSDVLNHIRANDNKRLSGSIIISDGQVNLGEEIFSIQNDEIKPIYILGAGDEEPFIDVSIQSIDAPPVIIKGENAELDVTISSMGQINQKLNITLFSEKKLLGSKIISISGRGSTKNVRFMTTPENLGEIKYKVQINALSEEINIENNKQVVSIQVLKNKYQIAIITGAPNFNTQIIKKIIQENPKFEFDHFVLQSRGYSLPLKTFWDTKYDLIIFDNHPVKNNALEWKSYLRVFAKKILSQKSSLAIISGYDIDKNILKSYLNLIDLNMIESVIELQSELEWEFTSEWESYFPFQMNKFDNKDFNNPPLSVNFNIDSTNGTVLAKFLISDMEVPLLLLSEKIPLRYMVWSSPELNQLYYKTQNTNHKDFTNQIMKPVFSWLTRTSNEREFYFRSNKDSYQQGEQVLISGKPIQKNISVSDAYIHIYNNGKSINTKKLFYNKEEDIYTGRFWASESGTLDYDIEFIYDDKPMIVGKGTVQVQESQIELNNIFLNKLPLIKLAENTNGSFFHWDNRLELLKLINKEMKEEYILSSITFNKSILIVLMLLILVTLEWVFRRNRGML